MTGTAYLSGEEWLRPALVLLALFPLGQEPRIGKMIKQGRAYLIGRQLATGGWPGTTRPSGAPSYAH